MTSPKAAAPPKVLSYQVKAGTPGLLRRARSGQWRPYLAQRTQWYDSTEACTAGRGQLLFRRGEWELLVDDALVARLYDLGKGRSERKRARFLSLEEKVLASLRAKRPQLSEAEVQRIFGYALDPDGFAAQQQAGP